MGFRITFLGTGGGRHSTMYQTRCTGGMLIEHGTEKHHLHIDPGPGALTQMHRIHYDLANTDSIIISHAHPDHYSDAEVAIEGMTHGGWIKHGHIYGSPTVITGDGRLGPCISQYHQNIAETVTIFKPGDILDIDGLHTEICFANHSDPTNVGFKFSTPNGIVAYVSDTGYTDEIADQYIGVRVLILPVTAPNNSRILFHLCTEDAIKFINRVKPELAVFTHLGIIMIKKDPVKQAEITEKATGIRTIAGTDLLVLDIGEDIMMSNAQKYDDEWIPPSAP